MFTSAGRSAALSAFSLVLGCGAATVDPPAPAAAASSPSPIAPAAPSAPASAVASVTPSAAPVAQPPVAPPLSVAVESSEPFTAFVFPDGLLLVRPGHAWIFGPKGLVAEPDLPNAIAKEKGKKSSA